MRRHEQRIDFDLGDLRVLGGDRGERSRGAGGRGDVEGCVPPCAIEQWCDAKRPQELLRLGRVEWGKRNRDVAEDLGIETARTDERDGAEARVAAGTDDQLHAVDHVGHRLHGELRRPQPVDQVGVRPLERGLVPEPDHDTPLIGLME